MTLDDDGTPSNGIEIMEAVANLTQGETMNFAQTTSDFAAAGDIEILVASLTAARTAGAQVLASVSDAQSHFSNSMGTLLTGDYSGTWSGDGSGAWSGIVTTGGIFTGTGTGSEGTVNFTGTVSTDGSGTSTFGSASDGSTFAGTIGLDGTMSGTWTDGFYTGTYSGSKASNTDIPTETSSGSLTLVGVDTGVFGSIFEPIGGVGIGMGTSGGAMWNDINPSTVSPSTAFKQMSIGGSSGQITYISFGYFPSPYSDFYQYSLSCEDNIIECNKLSIDMNNRRASFNNLTLPPTQGNDLATGSLTVNGSLVWELVD